MADTATKDPVIDVPLAPERAGNRRRARLLALLAGIVALGLIGYGLYYALYASHFVSTDNAYVGADSAQITPLVSGPVEKVLVSETQWVKAGDPLVQLDAADAKLALAEAKAGLARAQADYTRSRIDLTRRKALAPGGAVSADELTAAQNAFNMASAALEAAKAKVESADLALSRMTIAAPVSGIVSNKTVRVGQRVEAGQPLMVIAPIQNAYVDANFKEGQLRKVAIGQKVTLESDLYGGKVTYHGVVQGLSGGTGAAFSLIPAQNASGNWIKVVQRVPVRIKLDPAELKAHPLRVGMSMTAKIDVSRSDISHRG
jgi:membrane fusion protein (multidrug efflux system)